MRKTFLAVLAGSSITAIATSVPAYAQPSAQPAPSPAATEDEEDEEEGVTIVTGTQIRGVAPVGSSVTNVGRQQIKDSGVLDTNHLLGQLPQSSFFLDLPQPGSGVIDNGTSFTPTNRPVLRNFPGGLALGGSGALTLVLMDGHRLVPSGIEFSGVESGVVPGGILERMEVIFDGVSAVYGSDAVGGVMNFITRKLYDGIDVSARYGFADDYWQADASVTAGTTWETSGGKRGGITFNYEFTKSTNILSRERDHQLPINWVNPLNPATGLNEFSTLIPGGTRAPAVNGLQCDVPNISTGAGGTPAHPSIQGAAAPLVYGQQYCFNDEFNTYTPSIVKHSGFVVFSQDITDNVKFDVTGFYSNRLTTANDGSYYRTDTVRSGWNAAGTIFTAANMHPYFRPVPNDPSTPLVDESKRDQVINYSLGPVLGNDAGIAETTINQWQITPELTVDLGSDWQVRASYVYGRSNSQVEQGAFDGSRAASYFPAAPAPTAANTIDPYWIQNPANASNLSLLLRHRHASGQYKFQDARIVADGPLFALPGGEVRVSFGAEWTKTDFKKETTNVVTFLPNADAFASQTAKSAFGEVVIPIVGEGNAGFIHSLTLSASARYDDYGSTGGDTFNPKFAFTFEPVDWITVRGTWGTNFRAPNVAEIAGTVFSGQSFRCNGGPGGVGIGCAPNALFLPTQVIPLPPGVNATNTGAVTGLSLSLLGTTPGIGPETATNWSVGVDIRPPLVPGLTLSATYWNLKYRNQIFGPSGANQALWDGAPQLITTFDEVANYGFYNPACVTFDCFLDSIAIQAPGGPELLTIIRANPTMAVVYATDLRKLNLSGNNLAGIDASIRYRRETGFGSISASASGAWSLTQESRTFDFGPFTNGLNNASIFRATFQLGAEIGDVRVGASLRHQAGNNLTPSANRVPTQNHVPALDVVDLQLNWNVNGTGPLTKDLSLSVIVNNILNQDPHLSYTTGGRTLNGSLIGRTFIFGISKKFGGLR